MSDRDFRKEYKEKDTYELFGDTLAWEQEDSYTGPGIKWEWVEEILDEIDRLRAERDELRKRAVNYHRLKTVACLVTGNVRVD